MNKLILSKTAGLIWLAYFAYSMVIRVSVIFLDMNSYYAKAFANRIWAVILFIGFFKYFIYSFTRPNWYAIGLVSLFAFGVFNDHPISYVIADLFVLIIPLVIFVFMKYNHAKLDFDLLLSSYFLLNMVLAVLNFILGRFMFVDYMFLICWLFAKVKFQKLNVKNTFSFIFVCLASLANKTSVLQILALPIFSFNFKLFVRTLILGVLVVCGVLFTPAFEVAKDSGAYKKTELLVENSQNLTDFKFDEIVNNADLIFDVIDISTGQRIYEFIIVLNENLKSNLSLLFGRGLGSYVNLSATEDASVLAGHDNLNVRVFHLMLTFVFAKAGLVGLFLFFAVVFKTIKYYTKINDKDEKDFFFFMYFILVIIGMMFTFADYFKNPMFAVSVFWIWNAYKNNTFKPSL